MTDTVTSAPAPAPTPGHTANVTANAAWKESPNTEPLSGASGDVTKGEPYDAGNMGKPVHKSSRIFMLGFFHYHAFFFDHPLVRFLHRSIKLTRTTRSRKARETPA